MKFFTILESPDGVTERVALVPEGFAWAALPLTILWALWHRMWMVAAVLFALTAALNIAASLDVLGTGLVLLLQFAIALIFAFEARALQIASLERAGYRRRGLIQASNLEAAELAYFASPADFVPAPVPSRLRVVHDDPLGIFGNV